MRTWVLESIEANTSMVGGLAPLSGCVFCCLHPHLPGAAPPVQESVKGAAGLLGALPLSIKDMFSFCMAPASASDPRLAAALLQFATKYRWVQVVGEGMRWSVCGGVAVGGQAGWWGKQGGCESVCG